MTSGSASDKGDVRIFSWTAGLLAVACGGAPDPRLDPVEPPPRVSVPDPEPAVDWTGGYYRGDGLGANLSLELDGDGTYSWTHRGCLGLYASSRGRVELAGERLLRLWPEGPLHPGDPHGAGFAFSDPELVVVPWGEDVFLVPPLQFEEFCADVRAGHILLLGRSVSFYRSRSRQGPLVGLPDVPAPYRQLLPDSYQDALDRIVEESRSRTDER